MNIIEFLEARIAEDERAARDWERDGVALEAFLADGMVDVYDGEPWRRVLAECQAKRAIIARVSDVEWAGYAVRDFILEQLAAVYADHPDYQPEWRP